MVCLEPHRSTRRHRSQTMEQIRRNRSCDKSKTIAAFQSVIMYIFIFCISLVSGQSYSDELNLFNSVIGNGSAYNTAIRPLLDQSQTMNVTVNFFLISILTMDDKRQEFVTNAFMEVSWTDEVAAWNPLEYNNIYSLHPFPKDVWRPRMVLLNTLGSRDLFEDDYSPVITMFNGQTLWYPGSLFPASCKLNLKKYPFDKQTCALEMYSMGWSEAELKFQTSTGVILDNYVINGEWDVQATSLNILSGFQLSGFQVRITLQRRSGFFILNIVMPVVLLSFLNIIVFLIPVDSGEKISYGITVLLALAVFMSIVSDMLPRSSDVVPLVTIYLFVLLIISVLTVIVAIFIVWLHHRDEKEMKRQKASSNFKSVFKKVRILNRATNPITNVLATNSSNNNNPRSDEEIGIPTKKGTTLLDAVKKLGNPEKMLPPVPDDTPKVNKYKVIGRYMDTVSFFVFTFIWFSVTLGFTIELSS